MTVRIYIIMYLYGQTFYFCYLHYLIFFFLLEIKTLQEKHSSIEIENEDDVNVYYKIKKQMESLTEEYRTYIIQPEYCVPFFQPGRLVKVKININLLKNGLIILQCLFFF